MADSRRRQQEPRGRRAGRRARRVPGSSRARPCRAAGGVQAACKRARRATRPPSLGRPPGAPLSQRSLVQRSAHPAAAAGSAAGSARLASAARGSGGRCRGWGAWACLRSRGGARAGRSGWATRRRRGLHNARKLNTCEVVGWQAAALHTAAAAAAPAAAGAPAAGNNGRKAHFFNTKSAPRVTAVPPAVSGMTSGGREGPNAARREAALRLRPALR